MCDVMCVCDIKPIQCSHHFLAEKKRDHQDADQQLELLSIRLCLQRPEVLAQRKPSGDLDAVYLILKDDNFIMEGRS